MKNIIKRTAVFLIITALLTANAYASEEYTEVNMEFDNAEVNEAIFTDDGTDYSAIVEIPAPSAILMEKETGEVVYEKNADEKLLPASVTKVMTILLIIEAVESGRISLDETVTASSYASSMGGSQVYLEEGEQMPVSEMLKCIVVSSANDAAVAMAEHIAGSESAFADMMNKRAEELGMVNTQFTNCTGLLESDEHYTTSRDIALMSREVMKYSWIKDYTTIWMDTIRNGEFGLSNTNKLIYYYKGSTGLKTGFTQKAGYCLSATAERDGIEFIAVVMHCDTSNNRFESVKTLLNYGFANYTLADKTPEEENLSVRVKLGAADTVEAVPEDDGKLLIPKTSANSITKNVALEPEVQAPVRKGQELGKVTVSDGTNILAEIPLVAAQDIESLTWFDMFIRMIRIAFLGAN